jgi:hypothetical protein
VAGRYNGDREPSIRTSQLKLAVALMAVLSACLVGCSSSNSPPRYASASSAGGTRVGGTSAGGTRVGGTSAASPGTVAAGSAHVTVNGQSYVFPDSLTCNKPARYRQRWAMSAIAAETNPPQAVLEVDMTTDGDDVQLVSIIFGGNLWVSGPNQRGGPRGVWAHVRNEGNSYTVTGRALNPITNVVAPFEINATCR